MAFEVPVLQHSFKAAADLSAKQFYFVKLDSSGNVVICAAVTDIPIGILQNAPTSGQTAEVLMLGISKCVLGGTVAVGSLVGTDGNGKGAAYAAGTDTTKYLVARYLGTAAGSASDIGTVAVNTVSVARGA